MNIKEALQLLAMMIPTFIVLGAAALTLAFPSNDAFDGRLSDVLRYVQVVAVDTEFGPLYTAAAE